MPPPLAAGPAAGATAPPDAGGPPPGPGAVPSGDEAGGTPAPDQGQGMLPPSAAAQPQDVKPAGNEALGMQLMRNITGALHYARMFFGPTSKYLQPIDAAFRSLSKHFNPDSETMKGGKMPPAAQVAQPQGPGGGPPLGGMGGAAGGPPSPPRGPMMAPPGGGR